ncbi:MAG: hypothetical protein ACYS15_09630 [Planctomycetota bacterium]
MARARNLTGLGVLAAAGLMALSGCASTEKADVSMGAVNDVCPMSGRPIDPNGPTVEYDGKTVGFCCGGCVSPWDKMTRAEKDAFLAQYE